MNFWYYAFWYLFVGVVMDVGLSRNTRPSMWSILLWPFIGVAALVLLIVAWFKSDDPPRRYE